MCWVYCLTYCAENQAGRRIKSMLHHFGSGSGYYSYGLFAGCLFLWHIYRFIVKCILCVWVLQLALKESYSRVCDDWWMTDELYVFVHSSSCMPLPMETRSWSYSVTWCDLSALWCNGGVCTYVCNMVWWGVVLIRGVCLLAAPRAPRQWKRDRHLGIGGFGQVFLCYDVVYMGVTWYDGV